MPVAAESCGRYFCIDRSLRSNRAVVEAQSCGRCFCIDQSMRGHRAVKIMRPIQMLDGEGEIIFIQMRNH